MKNSRSWLVYHIHDPALLARARTHFHGRLLDIGCAEKPYQPMLAPLVSKHFGVDHPASQHDTSRVDLLASAYQIPLPDGSFDCALCSAVLEHLEEPQAAINECFRLLKPGGVAIYSVPFIWHLHEEPRDFFRYSKYGLEYLFQKAGFEILEIKALSGFWVTFGQLLVYNLYRHNKPWIRWTRIVNALGLVLQWIALGLDKIDRAEKWTWAYLVVARKPHTPSPSEPPGGEHPVAESPTGRQEGGPDSIGTG